MARPTRRKLQELEKEKLEQTKLQLAITLRRAIGRRGWSQKYAAQYLGTSEASLSRVLGTKPEQATFNQLFSYLTKLEPGFEILISI